MNVRILLVASLFTLSGCVIRPASAMPEIHCVQANLKQDQAPAPAMPPDFSSRFPSGTQTRSDQEINQVFYQARGAFNAIFTRAWHTDPCLTGGVIYNAIAIRPDGTVADAQLISTQISDPAVAEKFTERIKRLQFPPTSGDGYYVFVYPIRVYPS